MTYIQLVNSVLRRLRETEVSSVNDNAYSKMIATFVNDAKKEVEDSYDWNALVTAFTITTVADQHNYTVTGLGDRFKVQDFLNDSQDYVMQNIPAERMNRFTTFGTPQKSSPLYYTFSTVDETTGDSKVDLFPIPDKAYTLVLDAIVPQDDLSSDSDVLKVPAQPVILGAYARALAERGEDGGLQSSEAYFLFNRALGDAIAIQAAHHIEQTEWVAQ